MQFFATANPKVAASAPALTNLGAGYLTLPLFFAFTTTFYRGVRQIGW